jgi:apolipoprotein N-acyltransferase
LLVILSGILQVLIFPLPGLYWLSWVALVPLLVALLRARQPESLQLESAGSRLRPASPGQAFLLAYLSGILWYGGTCYWIYSTMRQYGGMSVPLAALALLLFCLYVALYHGLFGLLLTLVAKRDGSFCRRALLAAPFLWVATELARTRITGLPWELLGTAQVDNIPLTRVATVTGVYGLSFEIMLVNTVLAAAFLVPRERRMRLLAAGIVAALILQSGRWISPPPLSTDRVAVLLQENMPILDSSEWTTGFFRGTLADLSQHSISAARASQGSLGAALIVWPESPTPFYTSDPVFRDAISNLGRATQAWVITGSLGVEKASLQPDQTTRTYNSAALVSPAGDWVGRYDKIHLVPFGEFVPFPRIFAFAGGLAQEVGSFSRGTSRAPLEAGDQKLGVFICYESVFPDDIRQFANQGAQVFVNLSNDGWYGDSGAFAQHLQQARMRAIENGRWLLRDTNTGATASIDPYGRIVASIPRKIRAALRAPYALNRLTTFYTRHGDWFAFLCAIISVAVPLTRFPLRKRVR